MPLPLSLTEEKVCFPGEIEIFLWNRINGHDNFFDFQKRTDVLFMQKTKNMVDRYKEIRDRLRGADNILEIGTLHGASAAFLHQLFEPTHLVTVDLSGPKPVLEGYRSDHAMSVIQPYYGVNQGDSLQLRTIIEKEFDAPIDLVIDDASHQYHLTKTSFETVFPYVRNGGIYVIEDWMGKVSPGKKVLPDLICEFVLAMNSQNATVIDLRFGPMMAWVTRGAANLPKGGFFRLPAYRE